MRGIAIAGLATLLAVAVPVAARQNAAAGQGKALTAEVTRGRYLVRIAGCNDCHTEGYAAQQSKVDEKLWLSGDSLGHRGPWGTTYASNLRLLASEVTEDVWVKRATAPMRPPMPWFNVRDMTTDDVRAIYRYLKYMGPAGKPAPAYVPPGGSPRGPVVVYPAPPPPPARN
jgi:mono/diheme cytochrome c family protein